MRIVAALVCLAAGLAPACAARVEPADPLLAQRIDTYMTLRDEAADAAGRVEENRDPEVIVDAMAGLRAEIQARRSAAREGDILGGPVAERLRTALRMRLGQDDGAALLARVEAVQPDETDLRVNQRYPRGEPRPSTPNELLEALPRMPSLLSYRFVGRDLLLLDRPAALIVDVLRDALPGAIPRHEP